MNRQAGHTRNSTDPVKDATVSALARVLEPLLELMLDAGVTVQELNQIAREGAVRIATKRIANDCGRENRSRVAILTGLPRSEVTRILNSPHSLKKAKFDQNPARRILAAWHDSPHFLSPRGEPAVLPIFGRKLSFEYLVKNYGGGIPVRAMLDELTQLNAVERLDNQRVRAKARVPISTGLTSRSISAIGERCNDLLRTLAHNAQITSRPLFEATAHIDDGDIDMISLVRREIAEQGANFINATNSLLNRAHMKGSSKSMKSAKTCRVGVTVFYFQDENSSREQASLIGRHGRRKNLRRRPATQKKPGPKLPSE
jgi:hypothetical protein